MVPQWNEEIAHFLSFNHYMIEAVMANRWAGWVREEVVLSVSRECAKRHGKGMEDIPHLGKVCKLTKEKENMATDTGAIPSLDGYEEQKQWNNQSGFVMNVVQTGQPPRPPYQTTVIQNGLIQLQKPLEAIRETSRCYVELPSLSMSSLIPIRITPLL